MITKDSLYAKLRNYVLQNNLTIDNVRILTLEEYMNILNYIHPKNQFNDITPVTTKQYAYTYVPKSLRHKIINDVVEITFKDNYVTLLQREDIKFNYKYFNIIIKYMIELYGSQCDNDTVYFLIKIFLNFSYGVIINKDTNLWCDTDISYEYRKFVQNQILFLISHNVDVYSVDTDTIYVSNCIRNRIDFNNLNFYVDYMSNDYSNMVLLDNKHRCFDIHTHNLSNNINYDKMRKELLKYLNDKL